MKVIVASFSKCGTKTLHKCLETLGYTVCDVNTNFAVHGPDWENIFTRGSTTEQFKKMYENVDGVCDIPPAYYWEEILRAFPDSKIILTMRENEDVWLKSWNKQVDRMHSRLIFLLGGLFTPSGRRFYRFCRQMGRIIIGCPPQSPFTFLTQPNSEIKKRRYREHTQSVLTRAPKDKLLVLKFSDGWKPLCDFLDKVVPDLPFPHENSSKAISAAKDNRPFVKQMKRELCISFGFIVALLASFVYFLLSFK